MRIENNVKYRESLGSVALIMSLTLALFTALVLFYCFSPMTWQINQWLFRHVHVLRMFAGWACLLGFANLVLAFLAEGMKRASSIAISLVAFLALMTVLGAGE